MKKWIAAITFLLLASVLIALRATGQITYPPGIIPGDLTVGTNGLHSQVSGLQLYIPQAFVVQLSNQGTSYIAATEPLSASGTQSISGCSLTSAVGGSFAGSFHSGTTGTCTVTITLGLTASNGYSCYANDLTTTADHIFQTVSTTTTATIAGTTASGDVVTWGCTAF